MWEIEQKYLQKDETIEYTDRPSMLSCIFSYIWVGLMVLTAGMYLVMGFTLTDTDVSIFLPAIFANIIFALPGVYIILKRLSTRFAISNMGLIKRTGIITTNIKTVPFKHVTSIEVKETIIGKIFRYAHLLIDTSGSGKAIEFRWDFINAAHKVKRLIEKHVVVKESTALR